MSDEHSKGGASVTDVNGRQVARYAPGERVLERAAAPGEAIVVEIPVRKGPISGIAISSDGSRLMVTNYADDSLSVIDTESWRVVRTVGGVDEPYAVAVASEDADRAYVSTVSPAYDSISVVDVSAGSVVATHSLALSVSDLAVSPDGTRVYASRNGANSADVAIVDTATDKVEVVDIADEPGISALCVRVSSDGSRLYVGTEGPAGGGLVVIGALPQPDQGRAAHRKGWRRRSTRNPARTAEHPRLGILDTVQIGLPIRDVALSPDGATAYVASCGSDVGAVVDVVETRTNKITSTRKITEIDGLLTGLTISTDGDRAYLVSADAVTVLCTLTHDVIGTVKVAQPSCVAESPCGEYLYIADYDGMVTVAPVGSTTGSVHESDWAMPELMQYEAALV